MDVQVWQLAVVGVVWLVLSNLLIHWYLKRRQLRLREALRTDGVNRQESNVPVRFVSWGLGAAIDWMKADLFLTRDALFMCLHTRGIGMAQGTRWIALTREASNPERIQPGVGSCCSLRGAPRIEGDRILIPLRRSFGSTNLLMKVADPGIWLKELLERSEEEPAQERPLSKS